MKKKLPGVFPGKVKKNSGNNKLVFYTENQETNNEDIKTKAFTLKNIPKQNIHQKINNILNSPNYIYKADVIISLKSGNVEKRIIGRNKTHLITIENELIPINDVIDIKLK